MTGLQLIRYFFVGLCAFESFLSRVDVVVVSGPVACEEILQHNFRLMALSGVQNMGRERREGGSCV